MSVVEGIARRNLEARGISTLWSMGSAGETGFEPSPAAWVLLQRATVVPETAESGTLCCSDSAYRSRTQCRESECFKPLRHSRDGLGIQRPVAAPASLGVFECLRLSRETQQPFAGDQLKRLASRNLPGLSLGARVNPIGDELASIVAPLEYDRP